MISALKYLRLAVSDPSTWCQGALARNRAGRKVPWYSPETAQRCVMGHCKLLFWSDPVVYDAVIKALEGATLLGVAATNDLLGHADVMAMIDRAIEQAKPLRAPRIETQGQVFA